MMDDKNNLENTETDKNSNRKIANLSSKQFAEVCNEKPITFTDLILSEKEKETGKMAEQLLRSFIIEQAEIDKVNESKRNILQNDVLEANENEINEVDKRFSSIAKSMKKIAIELDKSEEVKGLLEELLPMFKIGSVKENIMGLFSQMFKNNTPINWGSIVLLFFISYKILIHLLDAKLENVIGLSWMRGFLKWVIEFFLRKMADWVIAQGGWDSIRAFFGPSRDTMFAIVIASLFTWWYWGR